MKEPKQMASSRAEALRAVLEYLWKDEQADYLETSPLENRAGHIFNHLRTLRRWLRQREEPVNYMGASPLCEWKGHDFRLQQQDEGEFSPGDLFITPAARKALMPEDVRTALGRHLDGDWGEVDCEDWAENEIALKGGYQLSSTYRNEQGVKFQLVTESDRCMTTVLLDSEH